MKVASKQISVEDLNKIQRAVDQNACDLQIIRNITPVQDEQLQFGALIGRGGFSQVWSVDMKCPLNSDTQNSHLCVKTIREDLSSEKTYSAVKDMLIEARFLSGIKHENITSLIGISEKALNNPSALKDVFLIMDKLNETLSDRILKWKKKDQKSLFPSNRIEKKRNILLSIAKALTYLHAKNIIHRDIKPQNMGFDHADQLKIFDFGLSRVILQDKLTAKSGTYRYMAPEVLEKKPYDFSADTYSWAIVAYEVFAMKEPYKGIDKARIQNHVCDQKNRPSALFVPKDFRNLVQSAWSHDPGKRPAMRAIQDYFHLNKHKNKQIEMVKVGILEV